MKKYRYIGGGFHYASVKMADGTLAVKQYDTGDTAELEDYQYTAFADRFEPMPEQPRFAKAPKDPTPVSDS